MNYLICQDWKNTTANHAGMKYLCNYLEQYYPHEFKAIIIPVDNRIKTVIQLPPLLGKIQRKVIEVFYSIEKEKKRKSLAEKLSKEIKENDCIFLMEYCDPFVRQYTIAKIIKNKNQKNKIFGLSHLVPAKIQKSFSDRKLKKWVSTIDKLITFGHSLTNFYIKKGIEENKLLTTFHYVDKYYFNKNHITPKEELTIIAMGNQMRDTNLLIEIVKANQDVKFIICQGSSDLSTSLNTPNVTLIPFVSEDELRELMAQSDISLNVMKDTIGSNVIVTSMAMGLGMICSDVGSIRDYCDESHTLFCNSLYDFNKALSLLKNNKKLVTTYKSVSFQKSFNFSIDSFYKEIKNKLLQ